MKFGKLRKFIYSFHVPLFFFLSGMCYSQKKNKEFILKKIKTIYIPYLIFSIISVVIYTFMGNYMQGNINTNIGFNLLGVLYANPNLGNMQWNQPLWFLPCLMIQLILINIIENIIKEKKHKQKIRLLIVIIITVLGYTLSAFKIYLPFQLEAAMCMSIFTYIGILIKENKQTIKNSNIYQIITNKKYLIPLFVIITLIISCILDGYNETVSVMNDKYGNYIIYLVVSIIMITNVMLISNLIDKIFKNQKVLSYIGQNTLWILLIHKFPILFFQELCPIIKNVLNESDTLTNNILGIIISVIVIIMCMICKYIIDIMKKMRNLRCK